MLQNKDSQKLFEFKTYFQSATHSISNMVHIFGAFSTKSITKSVFPLKTKGHSSIYLLQMLILMPFLGAKNVHKSLNAHVAVFFKGKKDSLYDTMRDPRINWRLLLFNFAKRFIKKTVGTADENALKFLIVDDSDLEKQTPFFEGPSRVFNHVTGRHIFGYKLLALGFSDGKSFIPLDFSLHNEKGKHKNYGLTKKQKGKQYRKARDTASHGAKRKKEIRTPKTENLLKMVKRAIKHGIVADYLLTDSWFLSENMITQIRGIKNGALHIVSMCRMDKRKYSYGEKQYGAADLRKHLKQKAKRSKQHKLYYIEATVGYKGHELKLFFTRLSKRSKWRLLVSTNTTLSFSQAYNIYANRWAIEVFFKESKQLFGLGKNQSRDFDSQIASTTIGFIQYTMLALYKRHDGHESIGGLFENCKQDFTQQLFSDRIRAVILEIIESFVEILELSIDMEKTISVIIEKIEIDTKIASVFSTPIDKGGKKLVA